jgi:hypothetical protein
MLLDARMRMPSEQDPCASRTEEKKRVFEGVRTVESGAAFPGQDTNQRASMTREPTDV